MGISHVRYSKFASYIDTDLHILSHILVSPLKATLQNQEPPRSLPAGGKADPATRKNQVGKQEVLQIPIAIATVILCTSRFVIPEESHPQAETNKSATLIFTCV